MNKRANGLLGGALILTLSTLIVKIIGLVFKLPLSYILTDEGMNYFNTAYTVYTFFYILSTAGVPKAISAIVAKEGVGSAYSKCLTRFAFRIFLCVGVILSIVFLIGAPIFSKLMGSEKASLAMLSIAPSVAFVASSGVLRGYFMGKMNFLPIAISEAVSALFKLIFGLLFAFMGAKFRLQIYEISALAIFGVTLGSLFGFLYLFIVERHEGEKYKTISIDKRANLSKIIKISAPITASSASGAVMNLLDIALVMHCLKDSGYSELQANILYGNYTTLVVPMFNLVGAVLAPIATVMLPALIATKGSDFSNLVKKGLRSVFYISVPICFLFSSFSNSILEFLFEDASAKMAAPLLSLVSPSFVLMGVSLILNTALEAKGHYYAPLISLSLGCIGKMIISGSLIVNENIGLLAAPIGSIVCYLISSIISFVAIKGNGIFISSGIKPLILSSFFSIVALVTSKLFERNSAIENFYIKTILSYMIFAVIYCIFYVILLFALKKTPKNQQILQN